ncbi:hypothetical protein DRE_00082 [Drechslerella stenobrocha 248]|uniref:GOLD domain-containing protein n=1 Tax=Drechslerella stenobrocha 248 TaxID=1043628 RepID=W7I9L1_9PEZI|nr:hypothetical protein DRE_00082 [Drechslerella stenobrocha 248]
MCCCVVPAKTWRKASLTAAAFDVNCLRSQPAAHDDDDDEDDDDDDDNSDNSVRPLPRQPHRHRHHPSQSPRRPSPSAPPPGSPIGRPSRQTKPPGASLPPFLAMKLLSTVTLLTSAASLASALKFDLTAQASGHAHRCIRNFAAKDTLVVVTTIISGHRGDGQKVNIHIKDAVGNEYGKPKDVVGENRMAFTSHADAAFDVCFENIATNYHRGGSQLTRAVELDVDIGADARDWSAIQAAEKLKPVEIELRRIEELVGEIVSEMEYLRTREQKLRDTNESTNERVKWFAFATISTLVGLGAWQVVYLRSYFRYFLSLIVSERIDANM